MRTTAHTLLPDSGRVLARLFIPGQEMLIDGESRAGVVLERIAAMTATQARDALTDVLREFGGRHRDFEARLNEHFMVVAHRLHSDDRLTYDQQLLIGASFTSEYAVEAAALFNPSMVLHPDQDGVPEGSSRFLMSLRALGEGHVSSIEFCTGVIAADGTVGFDDRGHLIGTGRVRPTVHDRDFYRSVVGNEARESEAFVLDSLPAQFTEEDLEHTLVALDRQLATRSGTAEAAHRMKQMVACNYSVEFDDTWPISERVLFPIAPSERGGMEDARFVRFVDDDGSLTYLATYTAFDGSRVAPHLIATTDFRQFRISQMTGDAAHNKGIALFPRPIGGTLYALTRADRETISIAQSDDLRVWNDPMALHAPQQSWELIQVGNCGSPLETSEGWLVLTHGVGPMRRYCIGAMLLDLQDPRRVIGTLPTPLLEPSQDERNGYVPNVVYSCGAMLHGDTLVLPYGRSDTSIGLALIELPELLSAIVP